MPFSALTPEPTTKPTSMPTTSATRDRLQKRCIARLSNETNTTGNKNMNAISNGGGKSSTTSHEHTSTNTVQYSTSNATTKHNPRVCCGGYEAEMPSAGIDSPHMQNHTIRE